MNLGSSATSLPRVLVVEDETMLLQSVVAGLSRVPGIEVVGASTVATAVQAIDAKAPAMIISDIDLPDRSGIELLGELGARGLKPHIIFVSAYVKAYRAQIPPHAGVDVIEKPVTLEQLRGMVTSRLNQPEVDSSPFGVADYLQLASLGHHSVLIEVSGPHTNGHLIVVDGQAWTAEDETGIGLPAFQRLALTRRALVRCQTFQGDPGQRTLNGSAEALLLESARVADEASVGDRDFALDEAIAPTIEDTTDPAAPVPDTEPPPPMAHFEALPPDHSSAAIAPEAVPSPAPAPAPETRPPAEPTFAEWFERGIEASLQKRQQDALDAFREAAKLNPKDSKTQANIVRLEHLLRVKEQ